MLGIKGWSHYCGSLCTWNPLMSVTMSLVAFSCHDGAKWISLTMKSVKSVKVWHSTTRWNLDSKTTVVYCCHGIKIAILRPHSGKAYLCHLPLGDLRVTHDGTLQAHSSSAVQPEQSLLANYDQLKAEPMKLGKKSEKSRIFLYHLYHH